MRFRSVYILPFVFIGISFAQETNFPVGPQYLITTGSTQFLRPIATPNLSLNAPLPPLPSVPQVGPAVAEQPYVSNPELRHQANLFPMYYGYPALVVVELTSNAPLQGLPASINDTGFVTAPTGQWLREHGYGVTLADAAAYSRARWHPAARVYTNADIERLHQIQR
jgi:hypothetical protein